MGRMYDALRKAAEEREARRIQQKRRKPSEKAPPASERVDVRPPLSGSAFTTGEGAATMPAMEPAERPVKRVVRQRRQEPAPRPGPVKHGHAPEEELAKAPPKKRKRRKSRSILGRLKAEVRMPFEGRDKETMALRPTLPVDERIVVFHKVRDDRAEQFRVLRTNLTSLDPSPARVLVTSSSQGEGKSVVLANLAATLAEKESIRVLAVDANLRHPELAGLFGVRKAPGVSEFLQGSVSSLEDLVRHTGVPCVDVLPAGDTPVNPGALWVHHALKGLLASTPSRYDYVLVDTPAIQDYADATVMAPDADGVLVVVRVGTTPKAQAQQVFELLDGSQARVLGAFATGAR